MRRSLVSLLAAGAVAVLAMSCGGSSSNKSSNSPPANATVVVAKNIAFNPPTVTIKAGETVTWKFDDSGVAHNVTGEGLRSSDMTSGVFSHTFSRAGDYKYDCTIHSGMNGEVIVQ
jgi:plastocyanin